jgi:hypothetical protein
LVGEERLEQSCGVILRDADARVFNLDDDARELAGFQGRARAGAGGHGKRAAIGHGLHRVGEEVQKGMLHPVPVEQERWQACWTTFTCCLIN